MPVYTLKFFGLDGEFEYTYGTFSYVEFAFRVPRVHGMTWTFDGDGWSSENAVFMEAKKVGNWYISRSIED